jgi:hypothetical protein
MTFSHGQDQQVRNPNGMAAGGKEISIEAFGRFEPQSDPDAAAKFALSAIGRGRGRQMPSLVELLTEGARIGEIEGEPGWTLERRDDGNTMPGYAGWPPGAKYRAYVDPEEYRLAHPETFYGRAGFHALVARLVDAFERLHPDRGDLVAAIRAVL